MFTWQKTTVFPYRMNQMMFMSSSFSRSQRPRHPQREGRVRRLRRRRLRGRHRDAAARPEPSRELGGTRNRSRESTYDSYDICILYMIANVWPVCICMYTMHRYKANVESSGNTMGIPALSGGARGGSFEQNKGYKKSAAYRNVSGMQKPWKIEVHQWMGKWLLWYNDIKNNGMIEWMNQSINESINGWMYEWMNGWMNACMHAWMHECINGRMNEWMNALMNEWMH